MPLLTKKERVQFIFDCYTFTIWFCFGLLTIIKGKIVPAVIEITFSIWVICTIIQHLILPEHQKFEKLLAITGGILLILLIVTLFV